MPIDRRAFALSAAATLVGSPALARSKKTSAPEPLVLTARSPQLQWEGRTADMPDGVVRAGFPGVELRLHFEAAKLVLKTSASSDNVYLDIWTDGGPVRTVHLAKGAQDLVVFEGPAGEHNVRILRRNESWQGVWDVSGASIDAGRFLDPAPLPAKKIMLIGDSITCGEASDVPLDDTRNDIAFANAGKAYGKVLAAKLGAQCHLVSCGGRGLIRDWQGIRSGVNVPQFYERAAPDENQLWNHQGWIPDAVGICLGTNDFSQGIPDQTDFVQAYVEFVEKIRRDAPNAHIFVINSPMLGDGGIPKLSACNAYLDEAVNRLNSPKVTRARIGHYPGRPVNAHPIAAEHAAMAAELEPLFRDALAS
ncbi:hypothetical protein ABAC460_05375 [Asticcacaulis sp. AC460]|uniref:GDSL-type esterase/lipase family protein n=1 Tax=Asticcacaulis sp. AC460 TaxID=1282360 RepID=UPI0003C3CDCF|nr:GDSL-type esterase/lipase family protein [Asticcacaulis sp. AC460]ESQ91771.1 hypothetical protein ABAC460_05375 [Asticcacaulis sp. AC460]